MANTMGFNPKMSATLFQQGKYEKTIIIYGNQAKKMLVGEAENLIGVKFSQFEDVQKYGSRMEVYDNGEGTSVIVVDLSGVAA